LGGTTIEVTIHEPNVGDFKETVQFLEGETSKAYSIDVPSISTENWYRYYNCTSGCDFYINHHFYSETFVGGIDQSNINIEVIEAVHISGTVILPQPFVAPQSQTGPNNLDIEVKLEEVMDFSDPEPHPQLMEMTSVQISDGESSGSFDFKIKKNIAQQMKLSYRCEYIGEGAQGCASFGLIKTGFYNKQGSVFDTTNATLLSANSSLSNLELDILGFSVQATDPVANEETGDPGEFTVSRSGNTEEPLTIDFEVGGTATEGVDFVEIGTSITIPAGEETAVIQIVPISNNDPAEQDKTVVITLVNPVSEEAEGLQQRPFLAKKVAKKDFSSANKAETSATVTIISKVIDATYTISGTVAGLESGNNIVLQNNVGDNATVQRPIPIT
jgi:hypothetical protein